MHDMSTMTDLTAAGTRMPGPDRPEMTYVGLDGSQRAFWVSELFRRHKSSMAVILPGTKDAETFYRDLLFFTTGLKPEPILFPAYNILPYKGLSYHNEIAARRISLLYRLACGEGPLIVVAPVSAVLQRMVPRRTLNAFAELVMVNEEVDRQVLVGKLVNGGYSPTLIVEEPGDFCVRGGILDVFPPQYDDPIRIEFFGDLVESIRTFSAVNQRKQNDLTEAVILPARETVVDAAQMDALLNRIRQQGAEQELKVSRIRDLVDRFRKEGAFPGSESLIPLLYDRPEVLSDYLPDTTVYIEMDPARLAGAAKHLMQDAQAQYDRACQEGRLCVRPEALYLDWAAARSQMQRILSLRPFSTATDSSESESSPEGRERHSFKVQDNEDLKAALKHPDQAENPFRALADWIQERKSARLDVILLCQSESRGKQLRRLLAPYGLNPRPSDGFPGTTRGRGLVYLCMGTVSAGFVWEEMGLALVTETEIFGQIRRARSPSRAKAQTQLLDFSQIKKDDLVVHAEHGIGSYQGLVKIGVEGVYNDFLLILYKDDDRLYLPVDRLNMIQKYMGVDGLNPELDKMGGKSWSRVKAKVKKSVEKIAGELLKLYAVRKANQGHGYQIADAAFREFEAGFAYEETPDQLKAIEDVLDDLASSQPMDRLICGDVGYGKTEVALRAAYMVVNEGKQVAILVPTTILAEQHYESFSQRFKAYGVRVACLNRFRKPAEQREIVKQLKSGQIDIAIGTHRLLSKDVEFKELGLVVIDEEQRFGVRHKERLKTFRATVDVLALTATPIPRTLHMSLTGVRDISVISTPPEQRRAIVTYISEFDASIVAEAVRRELARGGQIFFVHNNINSIDGMARRLAEIVPEIRLAVAHGRMDEKQLEKVMVSFIERDIDMLVCTTIIEAGLDIPAANTILINRVDRFGLAQLYQLRGRVGRADEQAYAYLFIPDETTLTRDAQKRLKVLMEHSDLGAGFQIAMSDLQIRGGGSILGASQSGHIAAVGYDMFLKLMEQAVAELKGEVVEEETDPEINMNVSAFIPETYIVDIDQRMTAYRRLARLEALKQIADFKEELIDRYGPLPEEAGNLLMKIMLRVLAIKAGAERVDLLDQQLLIYPGPRISRYPNAIVELVRKRAEIFELTPEGILKARLAKPGLNARMARAKTVLQELAALDRPRPG